MNLVSVANLCMTLLHFSPKAASRSSRKQVSAINGKGTARLCVTLAAACLLVELAQASTLYRYRDKNGSIVLNRTIPPEFVGQGYEVLNDKGRVIEVIPPALTDAQIAAREAEKRRQEMLEKQRKLQEEQDRELKLLYSHPNDVVRILKRRIQDIQSVISLRQSQIVTTRKEIEALEAQAAEAQRKGLEISEHLISALNKARKDIANDLADIQENQKEMTRALEEFDQKIRRMEQITGDAASDYPPLLESLKQDLSVGNTPTGPAQPAAAHSGSSTP